MLCSPQFAYTNVTWWFKSPGSKSDRFSVKSASDGVAIQIPTPLEKPTNLSINPLLANSSGEYTCRVMSNYTKNYIEATRFVKVMTTPKAVEPFRKLTLPARYYASIPINCSFTGYPVSFSWYQGSVPFRSFPRTTTFNGNTSVSVIVVLASTIESTTFICNATNMFGSSVCEVAVDFVRPEAPTKRPSLVPLLPLQNDTDNEKVSVVIAALSDMLDSECCEREVSNADWACDCPHATPVGAASYYLPKRCLKAMATCANIDSLPSAPRDLQATMGPYSAVVSWAPPVKSDYLVS